MVALPSSDDRTPAKPIQHCKYAQAMRRWVAPAIQSGVELQKDTDPNGKEMRKQRKFAFCKGI